MRSPLARGAESVRSPDSPDNGPIPIAEELRPAASSSGPFSLAGTQGPGPSLPTIPEEEVLPIPTAIPVLRAHDTRLLGDVVNLSGYSVTREQELALSSCSKFRLAPRAVPYMQLISGVECAAIRMQETDPGSAAEFRASCADIIRRAPKPPANMSDRCRKVLIELSKNTQLHITPADKGGKMAILSSIQYGSMCLSHLDDPAYTRVPFIGEGRQRIILRDEVLDVGETLFAEDFLKADPSDILLRWQTKKLTVLLFDLKRARHIREDERRLVNPSQPYSGVLPKFYGLPKLHKEGTLNLRPIITNCGLYCDALMIKLKSILNCLLWGNTALSNSYELARILEHFSFEEGDILVSFDVSSLFTRVPVEEVLLIVEKCLTELRALENCPLDEITSISNVGIMKLLRHVLSECYFSWDGILYQQTSGLPMGSRLSPILANLYMEHLEHSVLCATSAKPKMFFRYVDDIIIVWNAKKGSFEPFLEELNSFHPDIKLTVEVEKKRALPFLDMLIKRPGGTGMGGRRHADLSIYRKETHSDRYIQFRSAHQMDMKRNLFRTLLLRDFRILQNFPRQLQMEVEYLKRAFADPNNGYPEHILEKWIREFRDQIRHSPEILSTKSRLKYEELFDEHSYQHFEYPTATAYYKEGGDGQNPSEQEDMDLQLGDRERGGEEEGSGPMDMLSQAAGLLDVDSQTGMEDEPRAATMHEGLAELDRIHIGAEQLNRDLEAAEAEMVRSIDADRVLPDARTGSDEIPGTVGDREPVPMDHGNIVVRTGEDGQVAQRRRPVMVLPYVPGTSDKLRKLGAQYGLKTWFAYPGRLTDMFSAYRGRLHYSKARDSVYSIVCSCGVEYIGESGRNLKVRVAEHMRNSSKSAISNHILNTDHRPSLKQTVILAKERNSRKRKIIESLCIENKRTALCNTGVSVDIPVIWQLCAPLVHGQLSSNKK